MHVSGQFRKKKMISAKGYSSGTIKKKYTKNAISREDNWLNYLQSSYLKINKTV